MLTTKFMALEQENQRLLGDLQQVQQYGDYSITATSGGSSNLAKRTKALSLSAKFDGTISQICGFLNHVQLVIKLHPSCYPTDVARVGLVGTLLMGTVLPWFAPLLEKHSPLIEDFDEFIKEFQANFGDTDSMRISINKIR